MHKIITNYNKTELHEAVRRFAKNQLADIKIPEDVKRTVRMCNAACMLVLLILVNQAFTIQETPVERLSAVSILCIIACLIGGFVLMRCAGPYLQESRRKEQRIKTAQEILELFYMLSEKNWYAKIMAADNKLCVMRLHPKPDESDDSSRTFVVKGNRIEHRTGAEQTIAADLTDEGPIIIITDTV